PRATVFPYTTLFRSWELVTDTPGGAGAAMAWTAGDGVDAVHVYKQLPDHDEWFVRWYVRYEDGVDWHHSGMWFGGYNPGMPYPRSEEHTSELQSREN